MDPFVQYLSSWAQQGTWPGLFKELVWLLGLLVLAWLMARQLGRQARPDSVLFGRQVIDGLLFPALALAMAYLVQALLLKQQQPMLFKLAVPVLLSLVLIRLCARVFTAVFPNSPLAVLVERLISWLAWLLAVLWITDLLPLVAHELEQVHVNFGKARIDLRTMLEGVLSSGLVLVLSLWVSATIEQRVLSQTIADLSMRKVASNVLRAILLLLGLLLVLSAVGVDLTALSVLGGALGVGLGLGLQKLAANYVSGFVVLVERSVRIGDIIRVDGMEGKVTDIKTRFTLLRDANGREAIIPNEMLVTQRVDNFSLSQDSVALQCPVTVGLENDVAQIQAWLCQAAALVPQVLVDPAPQAFFTGFSQDGLLFTVHFWVQDLQLGRQAILSEANATIWATFQKEGVALPPSKPALAWMPPPPQP